MPTPSCTPPEATFRIHARLEDIQQLTQFVRAYATARGLDKVAVDDLELAVAEASSNVVVHGYADGRGELSVELTYADPLLRLELIDAGTPIPRGKLESSAPSDPMAESGRGMAIIRACVDQLSYRSEAGFNRLVLTKRSR
jgi:anti-sigma regulatory factor (Ser/Thr protein kinase)